MNNQSKIPYHLYDFINKKVHLPDFIERETGAKIIWYQPDTYAGCVCPIHKDNKPSFKLKLTDDNTWVFHCFGCSAKGTIINFCMGYYGLESKEEAVRFICKKLDIKIDSALSEDENRESKKKVYLRRKIECAHFVSANQCRNLLRKNFTKYSPWVATSYQLMNEALDNEDLDTIEAIGYQATDKIQEK